MPAPVSQTVNRMTSVSGSALTVKADLAALRRIFDGVAEQVDQDFA